MDSQPALKTRQSSHPAPITRRALEGLRPLVPPPIFGQPYEDSVSPSMQLKVREFIVKVREVWKRFPCYHCFRKSTSTTRSSRKGDKRAESGASAGDGTLPTHLQHKASTGKRTFDIRLVREECTGKDRLSVLQPKGEDLMRMITDTMYYGNYKFDVELDTGSETGANQLIVWVAEKLNIETVPLKQFGVAQLLNALIEPERARLHAKLEEEQLACQQSFELEIAFLQRPYAVPGEKQGQKIPEKVKRKARKLREQMKAARPRLEVEFARRELWSLDRQWFDRDTLQAQSRVYGEVFFLRDFYFEEANDPHIRNFCRKFALDEAYRQQVLAGETRWV